MTRRYLNFLIVPEGKSKSFKFKLSFFSARVIAGLLAILLIFIMVLSFFHGKLLYEVILGKSLKQENERLRRYNAKVVELEKELDSYKRFVQRVAELAGAEYNTSSTSSLASYSHDLDMGDEQMMELASEQPMESLSAFDSIMTESDSAFRIPLGNPIEGWITQGFSLNTHGFGKEHPGIDFAAKVGSEVRTTADGNVIFVGWDEMYGNLVAIDHKNDYITYYGHNSKNLVNLGDAVRRGQVIALSGNTGRSSAPHLHYEIRRDDIPIDPEGFLDIEKDYKR
jgi:murein DD-endopeptidase MepM/ murein hydrolase activator NlpD